jgi:hypothetical protein
MGSQDASSGTTHYAFNLLDSKNWKTFLFKAQNKLEDEGHWQYIVNPAVPPILGVQCLAVSPAMGMVDTAITNPNYADWEKGNAKTMCWITEMVSDDQVTYIWDATMWKRSLAPRWTKGVSGRAGDSAKSCSKKYSGCWIIIKLGVEHGEV